MIFKFSLSKKIAAGYVFILSLTLIPGVYVLNELSENNRQFMEISEHAIPAVERLRQLQGTLNETVELTRAYLKSPSENKREELLKFNREHIPALNEGLRVLYENSDSPVLQQKLNSLIADYPVLFLSQEKILLNTDSATITQVLSSQFETEVLPVWNKINTETAFLLRFQEQHLKEKSTSLRQSNYLLARVLFLSLVLIFGAGAISAFIATRLVRKPIIHLKRTILAMSKGEIPDLYLSDRQDEIGLINNAFFELTESLRKKAAFAEETGKGNYKVRFTLLSEKDALGIALLEMNKSLRTKAEEGEKENWLKSGIAQMSDLLRNEHSNTGVLYVNIISFLSKYLVMNQGALYLIKEDRARNRYLEMVAGFACEKNKSVNKRVAMSEGYVGQVAVDRKIMTVKDIPSDYIRINSGLGDAIPRSIIIAPLLFENEIQGVVELATFTEIDPLQVELLEKLSGIIAATLDLINRKLHTELLLYESQDLNDKLIEREHALKQSNDELIEKGVQLKTSEDELREQQEELIQTNSQLEEKAQLLAVQNEEIRLKNEQLELVKEAIRHKAEELENTNRYKSEFLANMSHELRTPLNSILILANLLSENKENNLNLRQIEYVRVVKRSGSDLLNLINDILDLSKIESRKIELEVDEVNLKELGGDMESLFRELATGKNVNFHVRYGENTPGVIRSDKMRIEQVLKNLLSNAFKFTEKLGTVELTIDRVAPGFKYVNARLSNGLSMISLSVSDNGIGIAEDKQQLIFEAFRQADGSTSRKYGGTGLGLSISRELSFLLGGEIQVESKAGEGSRFTLFLPENFDEIKTADHKEEGIAPLNMQPGLQTSDPKNRFDVSIRDLVVMIMSMNESHARLMLSHITASGLTGIMAGWGDAAIGNAKQMIPDVLIVDAVNCDPATILNRIHQNPVLQRIPLYVVTETGSHAQGLPAGAVVIPQNYMSGTGMAGIVSVMRSYVRQGKKNVLVIEDTQAKGESISALINNPMTVCTEARSAHEAIALVSTNPYDLVVLDLSLPDMNGLSLLKEIKGFGDAKQIPVIVYTGKELSRKEHHELRKYTVSVIRKTGFSAARLREEAGLYLERQIKPLVSLAAEPDAESPGGVTGKLYSRLKGKKVLLVDDDIRNIFAMTSMLEHQECRVVVANEGLEALQVLKSNPDTDIILMDIMMPELDGFETIAMIRKMTEFKTIPIVAITAKAMKGDRDKCMEVGATGYISKPVDEVRLWPLMQELLQ